MIRICTRALVSATAFAVVLTGLSVGSVEAAPFDGKIVTSNKRIPTSARSKSAYYKKLKKQRKTKFWENKKTKQWKVYFGAFFRRPLNDLEVTIKLYDVSRKGKRMVAAFEQFLDTRGQKNIISYIKLDRDKFGVNKKILMEVVNRGKVLARGTFQILGEAEKFSGQVDFTEEEANSKAP